MTENNAHGFTRLLVTLFSSNLVHVTPIRWPFHPPSTATLLQPSQTPDNLFFLRLPLARWPSLPSQKPSKQVPDRGPPPTDTRRLHGRHTSKSEKTSESGSKLHGFVMPSCRSLDFLFDVGAWGARAFLDPLGVCPAPNKGAGSCQARRQIRDPSPIKPDVRAPWRCQHFRGRRSRPFDPLTSSLRYWPTQENTSIASVVSAPKIGPILNGGGPGVQVH